jgi:hypothetical protein
MTETTSGNGRKHLAVYAILERKDLSRPPFWLKIGTAFTNRDGSLSLYLDAFPIGTNKLQVREPRNWDEPRSGNGRPAADEEAQP